jgi:hypothetical protein
MRPTVLGNHYISIGIGMMGNQELYSFKLATSHSETQGETAIKMNVGAMVH